MVGTWGFSCRTSLAFGSCASGAAPSANPGTTVLDRLCALEPTRTKQHLLRLFLMKEVVRTVGEIGWDDTRGERCSWGTAGSQFRSSGAEV